MISHLLTIIKKDFKLLFRSKSSTFAVLFGPLLVILLVGLVFTKAGTPELIVGIHSEDFERASIYSDSLEKAFTTIRFEEEMDCSEAVRKGTVVSCISLEDGEPPIATIYVDPSDINIVYAVIDQVSGTIENETNTLRTGFADQLLDTVTKTNIKLRTDIDQLRAAKLSLEQQKEKAATMTSDLKEVRIDVQIISKGEIQDALDESVNARDEYKLLAQNILSDYKGFVKKVATDDDPLEGRLDDIDLFEEDMDLIDESLASDGDRVFAELISSVGSIEEEVSESEEQAQALSSQANQIRTALGIAHKDVAEVLASIEQSRSSLTTLDISEDDITNPIQPVIEPVVAEGDNLGFVFPYFITLLIMFTAVLLASSIIVRERTSRAFFRNFASPTPDWVFVLATYVTTLLILLVQLLIVYVVASFFITFNVFGSIPTALLLLFVVITFFSLLGMLIGYLFRSQEGVMLASITVSSILLFISDLILPLETLPLAAQWVVKANPFVLSSGLFKANLVFGFGITDFLILFLVLFLYSIILFTLIIIVQRLARVRYFELADAPARISKFLGSEEIPEGKELRIKKHVISSKRELLDVLITMSDEQYEEYATHKKNVIADWINDVYKDEKLAHQLRNKSRRGAISVLEKETK